MPAPSPARWLLLIHRVPAKPDYLRVKVRRQLRQLGAVAIKNSVYVMPASEQVRPLLAGMAREILQRGGEALVCEAQLIEGLADGAVEDLLRHASDSEYAAISRRAKALAADLRARRSANDARRRRAGQVLGRLRTLFEQVLARDSFGARGRETAAGLLSLIEDRLQGVDEGGRPSQVSTETPKGALWVTRAGVMVDRIASSWLIRRHIDSAARFKFVNGRGYKPVRGEIRFDMSGAEFTHEGDRCTFEVLIERFRLRDSALRPIAEIVHDLDLEDSRYGREEAAGVGRMIVGLAISNASDEVRLAQGGAVFDNLYEAFRRRRA